MIGRALDPISHDIFLSGPNIATISDLDKTVQSIKTRLLFFVGEWFLDLDAGTPYFQEIFKKPPNLDNIESIIKTRILRTEGVNTIISFDIDFNSNARGVTIQFEANTVYGSTGPQEIVANG